MTAARATVEGTRLTVAATPADTNEATLYTAGSKGGTVVWLCIANAENAANAATVVRRDSSATTDYPIYTAKSVSANDSVMTDVFLQLDSGDLIKVTSGDADELTFTITVIENLGAVGVSG